MTDIDSEKRWYLLDGTEVLLLEKTSSGCIVERVYEGDPDREPPYSKPFLADAVFDFEHFAKEHPDVTKKREELAKLNDKLAEIRAEIRTAENERPALLARLKQISALANIEDFIEGRITHFVHSDYAYISVHGVDLLDYKEEGRGTYPKRLRLLSLYGASNGDLSWNLNMYYDGSGHSRYQVWPFTSLDAATAFARGMLMEKVAKLADECNPEYLLESFRKCGIEAPVQLVEVVEERKRSIRQQQAEKLRKDLAALEHN